MPTITNDYSFTGGALEGQPATGAKCIDRSFLNETGAVIAYGRALVWDAGNSRISLPSEASQKFLGVSLKTATYENALDGGGFAGFPNEREADYRTSGDIRVFVEVAVTPGDDVYFRHTANGPGKDVIGRFLTSADAGNADQVTGAKFVEAAAAGEYAILSLNEG